jgi:hypothetical protein
LLIKIEEITHNDIENTSHQEKCSYKIAYDRKKFTIKTTTPPMGSVLELGYTPIARELVGSVSKKSTMPVQKKGLRANLPHVGIGTSGVDLNPVTRLHAFLWRISPKQYRTELKTVKSAPDSQECDKTKSMASNGYIARADARVFV